MNILGITKFAKRYTESLYTIWKIMSSLTEVSEKVKLQVEYPEQDLTLMIVSQYANSDIYT